LVTIRRKNPSGDAAEELARICAQAAADKKARDILILDLRGLSYITDFFVIVTAGNPRQAGAIGSAIGEAMNERKERPLGIEGADGSGWLLLDYGDLVVHIFEPAYRKLYDLELLWGDVPRIEWQDTMPPTTRKPRRKG